MVDNTWQFNINPGGPQEASIVIRPNPQWASIVTNRLEPYKSLPNKFRPALDAVAEYFTRTAIPRVFSQEGPGWRQLSRRTQIERMKQGFDPKHPILVRTGDLFKELTDRTHPKHVEIIRVGPQARITIGGSSLKFVRNQLGNDTIGIPSRPMIPGTGWMKLPPEDDSAIRKILEQKIREAVHQNS